MPGTTYCASSPASWAGLPRTSLSWGRWARCCKGSPSLLNSRDPGSPLPPPTSKPGRGGRRRRGARFPPRSSRWTWPSRRSDPGKLPGAPGNRRTALRAGPGTWRDPRDPGRGGQRQGAPRARLPPDSSRGTSALSSAMAPPRGDRRSRSAPRPRPPRTPRLWGADAVCKREEARRRSAEAVSPPPPPHLSK